MQNNQIITNLKDILNRNDGVLETVFFDDQDVELSMEYSDLQVNFIEENNGSIYFGAINKAGENIYNNIESLADGFVNEVYFFIKNNVIC